MVAHAGGVDVMSSTESGGRNVDVGGVGVDLDRSGVGTLVVGRRCGVDVLTTFAVGCSRVCSGSAVRRLAAVIPPLCINSVVTIDACVVSVSGLAPFGGHPGVA